MGLASANVRAVVVADIRPSKVKVSSKARTAKDANLMNERMDVRK
jgi:hypothetical protein